MIVALANNSMYICPILPIYFAPIHYIMLYHAFYSSNTPACINILNRPLPNNIVNIIINICFPVCTYISIFSCAAVIGTLHKCLWLWNKYILLFTYFTLQVMLVDPLFSVLAPTNC